MLCVSCSSENIQYYSNIEYGIFVKKVRIGLVPKTKIGQYNGTPVYAEIDKNSYNSYMQKGLSMTLYCDDTEKINLQSGNIIYGVSVYNENILISGVLHKDIITVETEYQDVWIENNGKIYKLIQSNYNVDDKPLKVSFYKNGQYVVCYNQYAPPYGFDEEDKYVYIIDVKNIDNIKKKTIEIEHCVDFEIVNDDYIYCVEYVTPFEGSEDYSFAICKAESGNLNKVDTIAIGAKLVSISYDGRYMLAKKELYGKSKFIIIDVDKKRCAYLMDDKHIYNPAYYDPEKKQFFIDCGESFVYLEMPKEFPHNALDYRPTNKFEDEKFWKE